MPKRDAELERWGRLSWSHTMDTFKVISTEKQVKDNLLLAPEASACLWASSSAQYTKPGTDFVASNVTFIG